MLGVVPYESARDLPSFVEMEQGLRAMRLLRFLLPKDERGKPKELRAELDRIVQIVDGFYERLGGRHWIFHDDLHLDRMDRLSALPTDEAEKALIAY